MQSAEESNEIEGIHPVNDGNGCMRRLLTTLLLYRAGHIIGRYVSLESKIAKDKEPYYATIEQCQNGWHVNAESTSSIRHAQAERPSTPTMLGCEIRVASMRLLEIC